MGLLSRGLTLKRAYFNSAELFLRVYSLQIYSLSFKWLLLHKEWVDLPALTLERAYYRGRAYNKVFTLVIICFICYCGVFNVLMAYNDHHSIQKPWNLLSGLYFQLMVNPFWFLHLALWRMLNARWMLPHRGYHLYIMWDDLKEMHMYNTIPNKTSSAQW